MADLVGVIGTTHNPMMWGRVTRNETPDDLAGVVDNFTALRSFVSDTSPDAIVVVGSDHFHMLFTNNMPAFLIEAAFLSSLGGGLGLAAGFLAGRLFERIYPAFPVEAPDWAVGGAIAVSVLVGLVFGVMPARRAARLDPVRALAGR